MTDSRGRVVFNLGLSSKKKKKNNYNRKQNEKKKNHLVFSFTPLRDQIFTLNFVDI